MHGQAEEARRSGAAEHRLSLEDTVGRWLPGVVHGNGNDAGKITVRELLQHTAGLHNYTDDLQAQITSPEAYRQLEFRQFSRQDLLNIALAHRPDFAPGTGWNYRTCPGPARLAR